MDIQEGRFYEASCFFARWIVGILYFAVAFVLIGSGIFHQDSGKLELTGNCGSGLDLDQTNKTEICEMMVDS